MTLSARLYDTEPKNWGSVKGGFGPCVEKAVHLSRPLVCRGAQKVILYLSALVAFMGNELDNKVEEKLDRQV